MHFAFQHYNYIVSNSSSIVGDGRGTVMDEMVKDVPQLYGELKVIASVEYSCFVVSCAAVIIVITIDATSCFFCPAVIYVVCRVGKRL
jgi:hypothetical protein